MHRVRSERTRKFTSERVRRIDKTLVTASGVALFSAESMADALSLDERREVVSAAASRWNAVFDALAEYDGTEFMPCPTARRMADILRAAVTGEE